MTKPRSQRLQVVLAVAERKRQEAERFLADAQRRVNQGENGIVQLQGYLGEYQQQFTATGREGISIHDLQVQQAFMQKITHTMQEQEQALQQARDQVQQVQAYWQQTYARQKGIENLVQKAQNEESHERDRKLQQEIDERSQHVRPRYI